MRTMLPRPPRTLSAVLLLSALLAAAAAPAQTVTGTVADATSGARIPDASITLLDHTSGVVLGRVQADSQGVFSITAPRAGEFRVRAERVGFHAVAGPAVRLKQGTSFPVELRMHSRSVRLEEVVVTGRVTPPFRNRVGRAFFERMQRRDGHFFTPEMLAARQPVMVTSLLWPLPGIRPVNGGRQLLMRTTAGVYGPRVCSPTVYVDGREALWGRRLDDLVDRNRLWGIEVYTNYMDAPPGLPPQPNRRDCGVIAIWTIDA